jgi:excisionase family DNA binding protein
MTRDELDGVLRIDGQEFLTTSRAAKELGLTASTLRTVIQQGKLHVKYLHARSMLVSRAEVERYRHDHLGARGKAGRSGRKKKPASTGPVQGEE